MSEQEDFIKRIFTTCYRTRRSIDYMEQYDADQCWQKLRRTIRQRQLRRRITLAASVAAMLVISFTAFYINSEREAGNKPLPLVEQTAPSPKVILSLPNGRQVDLSADDGRLATETGIVNDRQNKQLVYTPTEASDTVSRFHQLDVPAGAEYHLVLADGTKVWINAESQLIYPLAFGDTREVKLKGEAYFEVTHDAARPFVVQAEGSSVKVLGTEFNVNTHPAQRVQTVLVKGKVEVTTQAGQRRILQPGELAESSEKDIQVSTVNVAKYIAWRYGEFYFENASLEEIMQALSSWYNVQAVFVNPSLRERKFSGILKRSASVKEILTKIERTTSVHFSLQGRTVRIE